ncbi:hypothetical protein LXL04_005829 [Taraxacum kok-saghyz]
MEVEMEDDNSSDNVAVEFTFTAVEIDLDYEFEAARFFDFTREESTDEAREAEMWFDSVESYPPSPFAARLLSREKDGNESKGFNTNQLNNVSYENANILSSSMPLNNTDGDVANRGLGVHLDLKSYSLQTFQKPQPKRNDNFKSKTKSRTSTLMKPTASQLAKQNQERLIDHSRFPKSGNSSVNVEGQAAKRQKLEGGLLCKVTDTKQQANFIHKAPKREGGVDGNKMHITVPRQPELATAQRALRSQRIRQKGDTGNEHVVSRSHGFRALPLNRKIFEAPSLLQQKRSTPQLPEFQEFHLRTTERAVQSTSSIPSTSSYCNNLKVPPQKPRFTFGTETKQEDCETISRFKALPLNKKIFSSKGDLGLNKSSKKETTIAMGFNFQTEKRAQNAPPPIDLFNNLTLDSGSELNRPTRPRVRHPSIFMKGSKENRVCSLQQQQSEVNVKTKTVDTIARNLGSH